MKYKAYNIKTFKELNKEKKFLPEEEIKEIEIASLVFPFKVNDYVLSLIGKIIKTALFSDLYFLKKIC
jgi:L-lysine 2,3-aminomutase